LGLKGYVVVVVVVVVVSIQFLFEQKLQNYIGSIQLSSMISQSTFLSFLEL